MTRLEIANVLLCLASVQQHPTKVGVVNETVIVHCAALAARHLCKALIAGSVSRINENNLKLRVRNCFGSSHMMVSV